MKFKSALSNFLLVSLIFNSSCSSVSLPSIPLPSLPWSSTTTQANPDATALFAEGMDHFKNKRYLTAIDRFQRVKTEFPFAPEVTPAELKIAESHYLNKQYAEAVAAFKEFQSLHPNNENIPFVIYHLGLSHLDQFTAADRDQKMTELAKGYFETVVKEYPNTPYGPLAQEKLGQCMEYLAEQEFMVASFYLRKEKYPAARERLHGIVRRYGTTTTSVKALFYLGEAYRLEKNTVKAALAYSAFVQRFPQHELTPQAQTHLAEVMRDRQDPLALLLMRDGRPVPAQAPESTENSPGLPTNLVAKKGFVHEEPGEDKGFVRRVVDKLNPFSSSDDDVPQKKESIAASTPAAKKNGAQESEPGFFGSVWRSVNPFAKSEKPQSQAERNPNLVTTVDSALTQKGVQPATKALVAPVANLPQVDQPPTSDPAQAQKVLKDVDARMEKNNGAAAALPPIPEAHAVFDNPAARARFEAEGQPPQASPSKHAAGVISSIDEKLKSRGIDPGNVEAPFPVKPPPQPASQATVTPKQKVELDSRLPAEKGPFLLGTGEYQAQEKPQQEEKKTELQKEAQSQPATDPDQIPAGMITGARIKETPLDANTSKKEDASGLQGALEQLRKDAEGLEKVFNPLSW